MRSQTSAVCCASALATIPGAGHVLAFYGVPNEFGLDRWLLEYQDQESGRSALLRPIQDATRAMAMFYSASADFDVDPHNSPAREPWPRSLWSSWGPLLGPR
ncbi:hypothetical protein ACW4TU_29805 [Streptomyces sp. QTS52]